MLNVGYVFVGIIFVIVLLVRVSYLEGGIKDEDIRGVN